VEGVPHITGRVVGGDVEQFEVVFFAFDFARAVDLKAHLGMKMA
jgi:hypothetical protein